MVPHRKILQAIALVAMGSTDPEAARERLCREHRVRFPDPYDRFWTAEVLNKLPIELHASVVTTDAALCADYRPILAAAKTLGLDAYVVMTADGCDLRVAPVLVGWRKHEGIRMAMEVMLLCGMPAAQISEDMRRMYNVTFEAGDITTFGSLYVEAAALDSDSWVQYMACVGREEATFKARLMQQPRDYVRWKLGVPVALNSEQVLDRLVSDSYYQLMQLKAETGDHLSKDEMARVKLERDTIFKALDRHVKMKELQNNTGTSGANMAAEALAKIVLDYSPLKAKTISELNADGS